MRDMEVRKKRMKPVLWLCRNCVDWSELSQRMKLVHGNARGPVMLRHGLFYYDPCLNAETRDTQDDESEWGDWDLVKSTFQWVIDTATDCPFRRCGTDQWDRDVQITVMRIAHKMRLAVIGRKFGITRERVQQITYKTIQRIRRRLSMEIEVELSRQANAGKPNTNTKQKVETYE